MYVSSLLGSGKLSAGVPGVSRAQHGRLSPSGSLRDRQGAEKNLRFQPLIEVSVFPAVCRKGRRAGGLLKAPTPVPPLPYHFPTSAILFSYTPPPPRFALLQLASLLFSPSSPVTGLLCRPFRLHAPSFLKRAPRPSEFQRVTQTVHCLTSTSTSCSCLGDWGGGLGRERGVVHSWVLKATGFKVWNPTDLEDLELIRLNLTSDLVEI